MLGDRQATIKCLKDFTEPLKDMYATSLKLTVVSDAISNLDSLVSSVTKALPWFVKTVDLVGSGIPFFAPIFKVATLAYGAACAMKSVRTDAGELGDRIKDISDGLLSLWETSRNKELSKKCKQHLTAMEKVLNTAHLFLTKYADKNKLMKFLASSAHADKLKEIHSALTKIVADTSFHLAVELKEDVQKLDARMENVETLLTQYGSNDALPKFMKVLQLGHATILESNPDVRRQLEVYVPLRYSLQPSMASVSALSLEALMQALLHGSKEDVAKCAGGKDAKILFLQGVAGTGKSLFGWKAMQYYDSLLPASSTTKDSLRIPMYVCSLYVCSLYVCSLYVCALYDNSPFCSVFYSLLHSVLCRSLFFKKVSSTWL